jgi:hypothetical protein
MNEEFLSYLWKYGLFDRTTLVSDTGEKIDVIKLGEHNVNSGPDFINAKIRIGNTLWAGNVELHLNASDWKRHRHQTDKAYDNVILHAVMNADQCTTRTNGTTIPTVELRFEPQLYLNYLGLIGNQNRISCHDRIARIDTLLLHSWLSSVMVERLEIRVKNIDELLEQYQGNWEEVFYIQLARSFGFHLNAVPFELVARSLPLTNLARHDNNLFQLEALLFGQAGFLTGKAGDEYTLRLKEEYDHLRNKYSLKPLDQHLWKFMRLRPVNFPTLRLAQFASLVHTLPGMLRRILETVELTTLIRLFSVRPSVYWETHYKFGTVTAARKKTLGEESSRTLLINTVIPMIFLYGHRKDDDKLKARAIEFLSHLPPEKNTVIARWEKAGVQAGSAMDTQALLQVWTAYCQRKQCLRCMVGNRIIVSGGNL